MLLQLGGLALGLAMLDGCSEDFAHVGRPYQLAQLAVLGRFLGGLLGGLLAFASDQEGLHPGFGLAVLGPELLDLGGLLLR